ncbi:HlyD family secretion protein [Rhodovastum atsumiense]|uniref:HlyD family secretion protein n=1 Tax=Rhodovastum atsumiense TaxID=504468 RepID=A0A5M6IKZ9_9PROT|nr:HlyD family secretion protein [Rhodovastum atsumiense]KAA5608852.1 HlyD family secretion protein [Rhodovastum atsumiense]CAH2599318.1 HlyD family secretion protein [Rhodovastum atsumiense]
MNAVSEKPAAVPDARSAAAVPSAVPSSSRLRRRLLRGGLMLAALVAAGLAGRWWLVEGRWIEATDNAYVQGDIAVLSSRIEGEVIAIPVTDNQAVRAGDPLVLLDPRDWAAKLDQARGTAAEAVAAVATTRRQVEQSRAAIAQSEALMAQATAERTRAAAEANRAAALVGPGWTSRQANDQAVADLRKAEAAQASARAQNAAATHALAVAEAQVTQAEARRVGAEAALRLAENNLSYTAIRAPFDGVVGNRAAQLGQHVAPGQLLIALAPPPARLFVVANFKETQLRAMRSGQVVRLVPDIDSAAAVTGRVDSLAPATGALFSLLPPENATGNFTKVVQRVPVKIVLAPGEAERVSWLRAGLSVTAEVDTRAGGTGPVGLIGVAAATLGVRRGD